MAEYRIQGKKHQITFASCSELSPLLFASNYNNYARYLTQHHAELGNLSITKPKAFSDLKIFGLGGWICPVK